MPCALRAPAQLGRAAAPTAAPLAQEGLDVDADFASLTAQDLLTTDVDELKALLRERRGGAGREREPAAKPRGVKGEGRRAAAAEAATNGEAGALRGGWTLRPTSPNRHGRVWLLVYARARAGAALPDPRAWRRCRTDGGGCGPAARARGQRDGAGGARFGGVHLRMEPSTWPKAAACLWVRRREAGGARAGHTSMPTSARARPLRRSGDSTARIWTVPAEQQGRKSAQKGQQPQALVLPHPMNLPPGQTNKARWCPPSQVAPPSPPPRAARLPPESLCIHSVWMRPAAASGRDHPRLER